MGIRSVTVVRGDRFAWLDFTNRPVTADRTRVTKLRLAVCVPWHAATRCVRLPAKTAARKTGAQRGTSLQAG